jgi:hypothetical protein
MGKFLGLKTPQISNDQVFLLRLAKYRDGPKLLGPPVL